MNAESKHKTIHQNNCNPKTCNEPIKVYFPIIIKVGEVRVLAKGNKFNITCAQLG